MNRATISESLLKSKDLISFNGTFEGSDALLHRNMIAQKADAKDPY